MKHGIRVLFLFITMSAMAAPIPHVIRQGELVLRSGTRLRVYSKCPKVKSTKKWPAVLIFGGFETGSRILDLITLDEPFCAITFGYSIAPPDPGVIEALRFIPRGKKAIHETLEGVTQLIPWARSQKEIDKDKITLVGVSVGAPFAAVAAARNPDVAGLVLIHGFGKIRATIARRLADEWTSTLGSQSWLAAFPVAAGLSAYIHFPPPEEELKQLSESTRVLLITATEDDLLPPEATSSLRKALNQSKASWFELREPGSHIRPDQKQKIERLGKTGLTWMKKQGLL